MSYWGSKTNTLLGSSLNNLEMKRHWEVLPSSKTCTYDQYYSQKLFTFYIAPERGKTDCESQSLVLPMSPLHYKLLLSPAVFCHPLWRIVNELDFFRVSFCWESQFLWLRPQWTHCDQKEELQYRNDNIYKIFKMVPRNLARIGGISSNIINFTEESI